MKSYSLKEIAKHNTKDSCWLIAYNKVYDVTDYIYKHPGGINSIIKKAGSDVSYDFDFHSKKARNIWGQYFIGYVENYNKPIYVTIFEYINYFNPFI